MRHGANAHSLELAGLSKPGILNGRRKWRLHDRSVTRFGSSGSAYEAERINSYELVSPDRGRLDPFTAGSSHRSPSAEQDDPELFAFERPARTNRYVIAVNKDAASRGGSKFIHETCAGRRYHHDLGSPKQFRSAGECETFRPDRRRNRHHAVAVDDPPA